MAAVDVIHDTLTIDPQAFSQEGVVFNVLWHQTLVKAWMVQERRWWHRRRLIHLQITPLTKPFVEHNRVWVEL